MKDCRSFNRHTLNVNIHNIIRIGCSDLLLLCTCTFIEDFTTAMAAVNAIQLSVMSKTCSKHYKYRKNENKMNLNNTYSYLHRLTTLQFVYYNK